MTWKEMGYTESYCDKNHLSTSNLSESQRTLHFIAENLKMDCKISVEGYEHFQMAIKALDENVLDKIRKEIVKKSFEVPYKNQAFDYSIELVKLDEVLNIIDKCKEDANRDMDYDLIDERDE